MAAIILSGSVTIHTVPFRRSSTININALAIGQRVIGIELARDVVQSYLRAGFSGMDRCCRRLEKIAVIKRAAMSAHTPV